MKKISSYVVMTIVLFYFLMPSTFALTNDEAKTEILNFANNLDTLKVEIEEELNNFRLWSNKYSDDLKNICTSDFLYTLVLSLDDEDYNLFIDILLQKLDNNGMFEARDKLNELKPNFLNVINKTKDFENNLYTFLYENTSTILISDLLPLINSVNSTYNLVRSPMKKILETYNNIYVDSINSNLKTSDDINVILSNFEYNVLIYDKLLTIFNKKMTNIKQITIEYDLEEIGFENKLNDDIKPYLRKIETSFTDNYNNYISKKVDNLKEEYDNLANNSAFSDIEKNKKLEEKINELKSFKELITNKIFAIKVSINQGELLEMISSLEKQVNLNIDNAITYLKDLLIVGEYDIILNKDKDTSSIEIDRINNLIVVKNSYDLTSFMLYLKLINGLGELKFDNIYNQRIGTKSILGIYNNNVIQKLYHFILKGDVRENGVIDISDVTYLIKTVLTESELEEYQMLAGDMNDDKKIDISDITATIKKALN